VLDDRDLRARLATAGRERVLSHHSWPASMRRVDALIDSRFQAHAHRPALDEPERIKTA
jgi:hypothetical protein